MQYSLAYHMFVDVLWNNGYVYDGGAGIDHLWYLLIFHAHNVDSVYFQQLMVSQQTVPSCRWVLHQTNYVSIFELESNMTKRVLVQSNSSLKRPRKTIFF